MKLFSDYHNHPLGHDPNRTYDLETLTQWLNKAKEVGLTDVAFTDHDRYHPGVDIDNFERFRDIALEQGVNFRMGIELDNDPETSLIGHKWTEDNYDRLDFVLGSIHFIGDWAFDHPNFKDEFEKRDINLTYEQYFKEIQRIAQNPMIDGLAHLDLIKIFGYRPTIDIKPLLRETLEIIKKSGKTLELSTAGWRKPVNELYPSNQILTITKELGIPITTASDAHAPGDLGNGYDRLEKIVEQFGFEQIAIFEKHKMKLIDLK